MITPRLQLLANLSKDDFNTLKPTIDRLKFAQFSRNSPNVDSSTGKLVVSKLISISTTSLSVFFLINYLPWL